MSIDKSKKTVLYVDDEDDLCVIVRAGLEDAGYNVLTAGSAADGRRIAFKEFPDLIITDVMMPNESGFVFTTSLKRDPSTQDIPVVIVTVMDEELRAMEAGAAAFISKPFADEELLRVVGQLLNSSDTRSILERGLRHLREGRSERGIADLNEVWQREPAGHAGIWARYYLALIEHKVGKFAAAREGLSGLLLDDPGFWRAHNKLAEIYIAEGETRKAVSHLKRSLVINENQPVERARLSALEKVTRPEGLPPGVAG